MISLCNRVRELSIIKISVRSRALPSRYDLEEVERIKEFIIGPKVSDDLTHRKYEA